MRTLLCLALISLCILSIQAKQYAVLVAFAEGWWNYPSQSTMYLAYHNLIRNGLHPDNIIVFAADDIANASYNPFPGQVFAAPSSKGGWNVYNGIKIDYRLNDLTPETFLNVIQGNSSAVGGRRVLNSTSEDNVFIAMIGHGAPGILAFPSSYLYADKLNEALKNMHSKNMFKKLVFYLDACHSGSMFKDLLPQNISVFAVTAAPPETSSYMDYCGWENMNVINGTAIGPCLGSQFTSAYLDHMEDADLAKETISQQHAYLQNRTTKSKVCEFGFFDVKNDTVNQYHADVHKNNIIDGRPNKTNVTNSTKVHDNESNSAVGKVSANNLKKAFLRDQAKAVPTKNNTVALLEEVKAEKRLDNVFDALKSKFELGESNSASKKINFSCFRTRLESYTQKCGKLSEYGLKYVESIIESCNANVKEADFEAAISQICSNNKTVEVAAI